MIEQTASVASLNIVDAPTAQGAIVDTVDALRRTRDAEHWRHLVRTTYLDHPAQKELPHYYYRQLAKRLTHVVEPNSRVLDIGSGSGYLLNQLQPSHGVGIDLVKRHVETARERYPHLVFEQMRAEDASHLDETFDYIILSQTIGEIYDVTALLRSLKPLSHDRTRLIIVNWNRVWQPMAMLSEWIGVKPKSPPQNWLPCNEIENLLALSGWETVRRFGSTIMPVSVPGVSNLINRYIGNLPLAQSLCLNHIMVARPTPEAKAEENSLDSVTVVIPARNESGHIKRLLARLPKLANEQEVIFVEGNSTDDTWDVIKETVDSYHGPFTLHAIRQDGEGKADAVRKAFSMATGDVLMILDADISVPPEELLGFRDAITNGNGEFINGSRMVYVMDKRAMRFLNLLGNKFFGGVFTYLLSQRFRDTLCGTKVLRRSDYQRIAENRSYFGDFDPFGDFDLLFGAARLNLKIVDLPVHYKARTYGETNISRFRHGLILLRMCAFAAKKIKFV